MAETEPILRRRRSYRSFAGLYLAAALLAVAIWVVGFQAGDNLPALAVAVGGLIPPVLAAAYSWVVRVSSESRIYQDSIEIESGLIARAIGNLQLFRVRDLGFSQSVLGRLLGVGDVTVTSTDQSTPHVVLRGIAAPRAVYDTLRELVARSQATRRTMIVEDDSRAP